MADAVIAYHQRLTDARLPGDLVAQLTRDYQLAQLAQLRFTGAEQTLSEALNAAGYLIVRRGFLGVGA